MSDLAKGVLPPSQRVQLALFVFLFSITTLLLLFYPFGQPIEVLRHGLAPTRVTGGVLLQLVGGLGAWLVCISCLIGMRRISRSCSENVPSLLTCHVLFAFVLFFAIKRLAGSILPVGWLVGSTH